MAKHLKSRLEVAETRLENKSLEEKIRKLEEVVDQLSFALKESTSLLIKQRLPPRPYISSTKKAILAQQQSFKCCNPLGNCPRHKLAEGIFGPDLWEVDHINQWSTTALHSTNLQGTSNFRCCCSFCHASITRSQIADRN